MTAAIAPVTVQPQSVDARLADARAIGQTDTLLPLDRPDGATQAAAPSFERVLMGVVDSANRADAAAGRQVDSLARGATDDLHGTMIAVKEAGITIHLVGSIRNKLLDAFHELWRTSV